MAEKWGLAPRRTTQKYVEMTVSTLSREKIFAIFRPIFLRTRVPPCVFSKNRPKSRKIAKLNPGANRGGSANPKNSCGSVDFDPKYTIWRGANPRFFGSFKKCLHCLPPPLKRVSSDPRNFFSRLEKPMTIH